MISMSRWKCIVALGIAGGAGGEAQQRHVVASGLHRLEAHRLGQRQPVELGIVIGGAVEADHLGDEPVFLGAGDHFVHQPCVAQRQRDLRLVDDLAKLHGAQHRHGVDHHRAGLGRRQPDATIAGLLAERISTRLPGLTP
jgi:hypothetical protein